jgi:mono/diheme cytochrome c family protein
MNQQRSKFTSFSVAVVFILSTSATIGAFQAAPGGDGSLKNPVPSTKESIARGQLLYRVHQCQGCHGSDGKGGAEGGADLTDPKAFRNGSSDGAMFRTISDGTANGMPSFKLEMSEDERWRIVIFIRSLQSAEK